MNIGEKILIELDRQGKQKNELAQYVGITPASVSDWISAKDIKFQNVVKAAEFLNISLNSLAYDTEIDSVTIEENHLLKLYRSLTTNGQKEALRHINNIADMETSEEFFPTCKVKHSVFEVSAGVGAEIGDYEGWDYIEVLKTPNSVKADFCLTIKGDSMQPMFDNGDIILVRKQPIVDIGQICVYNINNHGYVKKFGGNKLISLNHEYDDIDIPNQDNNIVKCCGLVLGKATVIE